MALSILPFVAVVDLPLSRGLLARGWGCPKGLLYRAPLLSRKLVYFAADCEAQLRFLGAAAWRDMPMTDYGHVDAAAVVSDADRGRRRRRHVLGLVPGFLYILLLFIAGQFIFSDPRATLFNIGGYRLAWVEVLLVAAAIMAMAEQIKVATPGVNNTTEVLLMGAIAIVQVVLFALA